MQKILVFSFLSLFTGAGFKSGPVKQLYMCKKSFISLLLAVPFFVTSCVDSNYDVLNKEISTDVKIEGNTVALPVGSLKSVTLNDLINFDEIEMLAKGADGVYAITMNDTVSVNEKNDSISLNIRPFEYSHSIADFGKAEVKSVRIGAKKDSVSIKTPKISVANLNDHLPHLGDTISQSIDFPGLDGLLASLNQMPGDKYVHKFSESIVIETGNSVDCAVEYELPEQIETISSIKLGSEQDRNGTLVKVVVTNPEVMQSCDKTLDFSVTFPTNFKLAKNNAVKGEYNIEGSKVSLKGFEPEGDKTEFSFYITEITDVDNKYIEGGVIRIDESVDYAINYTIDGELSLNKGVTKDKFAFDVVFDVALSFLDVAGKTTDVKVDFPGMNLDFNGSFSDLKNVSMVNSVEFDENASILEFKTTMDKDWFSAFDLMGGYALKISFPKGLVIDHNSSEITGKDKQIIYSDNAYYVKDLSILSNSNWKLVLKKLDLNEPVVDGNCELKRSVDINIVNMNNPSESGSFYLEGLEMESMVAILDKLNKVDKKAYFELKESKLVIANAVVSTTEISESFNDTIPFNIKEEVSSEIGRIDRITFKEDVPVTMILKVEGLESDINLDVEMSLPSFLKLKPKYANSGVGVDGRVLSIQKQYNPSTQDSLVVELLCYGIDFMTEEFGYKGYEPLKGDDEKSYISYPGKVPVSGKVSVAGTEFQLKNEVSFNLMLDVDEIVVKSFHGIYCADLPSVEEKIDIDLGEELEFLKDASLTLADPQLELVLTNPVGVPVDVMLQIMGQNENGDVIKTSVIDTTLTIAPAEYDEVTDELRPVETKYFLTTSDNGKAEYENVKIENLGNLLKEIPDSLSLNVTPVIKTGADVTHHVDILQPIKFDAAYSVVIPFKFNDLYLCYSDTISELKVDIDETMDMFSNVSILAKMDIINTIPLGLSLKIVPLDENGKKIEDIEIDKIEILAGEGKNLLGADNVTVAEGLTVQPFEFSIKSASGDISSLDRLAFTIEALSNSVTGSVGLKGEQGVKISNIVFEVSGDIEVDLRK